MRDFLVNNNIPAIITITLLIAALIQMIFEPTIDRTRTGETLIWYGRNPRRFIKL